jgi:hypothetical protein
LIIWTYSYRESDAAPTATKKLPELTWLAEVSTAGVAPPARLLPSVLPQACRQPWTCHWTCPECGARRDRDINAAKNIKNGSRISVSACGGDVSPQGCALAL